MEKGLFHKWLLFTLFRTDDQRHVYRRRGECFADASVLGRDMFGDCLRMVYGWISDGLKSPLFVIAGNLTGVRYRDEILRPVAIPYVQQHQLIF